MPLSPSRQKAIDLLFALNAAIINVRLYPQESALVRSALLRIWQVINEILAAEESVEYAVSETKLLVQGDVLPEKIQKTPRVIGFKDMMNDLGVHAILFKKGIDEKELADFLRIIARTPEEINSDGGLWSLIEKHNIVHVQVDEKIYMGLDRTERNLLGAQSETAGKDGQPAPGPKADPKTAPKAVSKSTLLKNALKRISESDHDVFRDAAVCESLPEVFTQLQNAGKQNATEMLLKRMGNALTHEDPEIRNAVAAILANLDEKLESAGNTETRLEISKALSTWTQMETDDARTFDHVSARLQNLVRLLVKSGKEASVRHVIESYHRIATGDLERTAAIRSAAENMLHQLAEEDLLDRLMAKTFGKTGETLESGEEEDVDTLVQLGSKNIEKLLDRLKASANMTERNRIIQTITQIGGQAVPHILQRLSQEAPWYYNRNLVLLLGRIGGEVHLPPLEKMLVFPDYRVQRETIKSIQAIDGQKAGRILHDHFGSMDEQLHAYIISAIGALDYKPAIPWMIELLSSEMPDKTKAYRDDVREKICEALGRMKADQAVSALENIIRKKGFFGKKNPENVRSAAARALAEIKRW